jgi:DNA-binding CsgD family transcriptional regulator/tetratricopeptide (TPR) repeat protein
VVLTSLANVVLHGGEIEEDMVARAVEVATLVDAQPQLADALVTLGGVQANGGDMEAGLATILEGLRLAERLGAVETTLRGHVNYSHVLEELGRHQEAIDFAAAGLELARRTGRARTIGAYLAANMVEPMIRLGRWREAETVAVQAMRCEPEAVFAAGLIDKLAHLAVVTGRREEAERLAEQTRRLVSASQDPQIVGPLGYTLGEARRLAGDLEGAVAIVTAALRVKADFSLGRYAWPLVWLGSRIAADQMILSRDRRVPDSAANITLGKLTAIAETLPRITPIGRGYAAVAAAERARATGPDTTAWEDAVAVWRDAAEPYLLAYCLLRLAEDQLAAGDRRAATASAGQAMALAAELGARPLAGEIEALARRGRLDLAAPELDEPEAGPVGDGDRLAHFGLTEREREVLDLLAAGRSNAQIAAALFISPKTASVHVSNILAKLGVTGRVEAAALVHRLSGASN